MHPVKAPPQFSSADASKPRLGSAASIVWVLLLLVGGVSTAGAGGRAPQLVIFATGGAQGYVDQCGCSRFPVGGLDRRAGFITSVRKMWPDSVHVLLDVGNFSDLPGPAGDVKTRGMVRGMNRLGYRVSGVGERDLATSFAHFRSNTAEAKFTLVSANLVRRSSGTTVLAPASLIVAGGLRIGVISVTRFNPSIHLEFTEGSDEIVTIDPLKALEAALEPLRKESDLVVLLAALPLEDARLIARRLPTIDLILGAHGSQLTTRPVIEGRTKIVYLGDQGKFLSEIDVYKGLSGVLSWEPRLVQLGQRIRPDRMMERLVVDVLAEAQEAERMGLTAMDPSGEGGTGAYVGAGACAGCHPQIVQEWSQSQHAHAMETLERESSKPNCVPCHVTGYGQVGGFIDMERTPHLAGVGCEACHGPGAAHLANPSRPYGRVSLPNCTGCHTAELDKDFNYYGDLPLVSHSSVPEQ